MLVEAAKGLPAEERAATAPRGARALARAAARGLRTRRRSRSRRSRRLEELRLAALEERIDAELEAGRARRARRRARSRSSRSIRSASGLRGAADARAVPVGPPGGGASRSTTTRAACSSTSSGSSRAASLQRAARRDPAAGCDARRRRAPRRPRRTTSTRSSRAMLGGRLVPVLGARTSPSSPRISPSGSSTRPTNDAALPRVAQYVAVMKGVGPAVRRAARPPIARETRRRRTCTASSPRCRRCFASAGRRIS